MLKNYSYSLYFIYVHEFFNKVYESSASTFVIRMISERFKRSEHILTRLFCRKTNERKNEWMRDCRF